MCSFIISTDKLNFTFYDKNVLGKIIDASATDAEKIIKTKNLKHFRNQVNRIKVVNFPKTRSKIESASISC